MRASSTTPKAQREQPNLPQQGTAVTNQKNSRPCGKTAKHMAKHETQEEAKNLPPMEKPVDQRSIEEALSEVEREMQVRERMYGKWITDGKISRVDAKDRGERMLAACHYLRLLDKISPANQKKFLDGEEITF